VSAAKWSAGANGLGRESSELEAAIAALRALNSAIWLSNPGWAVGVGSQVTVRASEIIATYEFNHR